MTVEIAVIKLSSEVPPVFTTDFRRERTSVPFLLLFASSKQAYSASRPTRRQIVISCGVVGALHFALSSSPPASDSSDESGHKQQSRSSLCPTTHLRPWLPLGGWFAEGRRRHCIVRALTSQYPPSNCVCYRWQSRCQFFENHLLVARGCEHDSSSAATTWYTRRCHRAYHQDGNIVNSGLPSPGNSVSGTRSRNIGFQRSIFIPQAGHLDSRRCEAMWGKLGLHQVPRGGSSAGGSFPSQGM